MILQQNIPENFTSWNLRLVFDKMKLYINRINVNEIKESILRSFDAFIVNNNEDSD